MTWGGRPIHIVGCGIDRAIRRCAKGFGPVRAGAPGARERIGASLAQAGIEGTFEGALRTRPTRA